MNIEDDMNKESLTQFVARITRLEDAVFGKKAGPSTRNVGKTAPSIPDFSLNIRAFARRFVADKSGPKKFVLLLAYLAEKKVGRDIKISEIQKQWNTMSAKKLLGKYNRYYPSEAKTKGWVDSKEYGTYCLTDGWKEVYEQ